MSLTLILGGARSGKSRRALELAEEVLAKDAAASSPPPLFIATAEAFDAEMTARIARHKGERGAHWQTREAPLDPAAVIAAHAAPGQVLLLDCLSIWLGNLMTAPQFAGEDTTAQEVRLAAAMDGLLNTLTDVAGTVILVSNEVGSGIVPENALARAYRDHAGTLNRRVATLADRVEWVVAGLPVTLKPTPSPTPAGGVRG